MIEWLKKLFMKDKPMKAIVSDDVCIQRLVVNEGMRLKPYKCPAGFKTIGIGRNLETNPLTPEEKAFIGHNVDEGINAEQAFFLCRHDIAKVKAQLDQYLPWWRDLNTDRQFVMVDLCFNMGINKLLRFQKTLDSISTGFYIKAGEQLLQSLYAKQVGRRAERNAKCLQTGVYK